MDAAFSKAGLKPWSRKVKAMRVAFASSEKDASCIRQVFTPVAADWTAPASATGCTGAGVGCSCPVDAVPLSKSEAGPAVYQQGSFLSRRTGEFPYRDTGDTRGNHVNFFGRTAG